MLVCDSVISSDYVFELLFGLSLEVGLFLETRVDRRHELFVRERLGEIIVSTELQLLSGIASGSFSRDDDDMESPPESMSQMAEYYEERFDKSLESIRKLNVKKLTNYLSFYGVFRYPAVVYLTFLHDHTVHHRGQLSSYAREMGSKISMLKGRNGDSVSINQPAMKYLWAERTLSDAALANAA